MMTFKSIGCYIYFGQPQDVLPTSPLPPFSTPHWRPMMYQQFEPKKKEIREALRLFFQI